MILKTRNAAILSLAAITLHQISNYEIKHNVDQRGGEQNGIRPVRLVIRPEDGAQDNAARHNRSAQRLRKILSNEHLGAGAHQAADELLVLHRPSRRPRLPATAAR